MSRPCAGAALGTPLHTEARRQWRAAGAPNAPVVKKGCASCVESGRIYTNGHEHCGCFSEPATCAIARPFRCCDPPSTHAHTQFRCCRRRRPPGREPRLPERGGWGQSARLGGQPERAASGAICAATATFGQATRGRRRHEWAGCLVGASNPRNTKYQSSTLGAAGATRSGTEARASEDGRANQRCAVHSPLVARTVEGRFRCGG